MFQIIYENESCPLCGNDIDEYNKTRLTFLDFNTTANICETCFEDYKTQGTNEITRDSVIYEIVKSLFNNHEPMKIKEE